MEAVYELDPSDLPVTVKDAFQYVSTWAAQNGYTPNPFIKNYRLNFVRPNGFQGGIWAWFMEVMPFPTGATATPRRVSGLIMIAVSMRGQIVPGECR